MDVVEDIRKNGLFNYYLKYILMTYFIDGKLYWFLFDYASDLIYLIDIFLIQTRIKFIKEGLWVNDLKSTALNYFQGTKFKVSISNILITQ
jgi:hypothetical protein